MTTPSFICQSSFLHHILRIQQLRHPTHVCVESLAMTIPIDSPLGRNVSYPVSFDPTLLFPISRVGARAQLGIGTRLPFVGHDRWQAYELSWLDLRGKPHVATATFIVPCTSPNLIESKSLKLYLNSFNSSRFAEAEAVRLQIIHDLSHCSGGQVDVRFGVPVATGNLEGESIDGLSIDINDYGPPRPDFLRTNPGNLVEEVLTSALLRSNCPVTVQPDWAHLIIRYQGVQWDREGLLRYLISFRNHAGFHEHCVEQIFCDIQQYCRPRWLAVQACYTRRGGIDINPLRYSPGAPAVPPPARDLRQ